MTLIALKNNFKNVLIPTYPIEEIDSFFYLLAEFRLQLQRVDIYLNPTQEISDSDTRYFENALQKLKQEIPIQYIIGNTEFYGLPFHVTENTLIPRTETEELVTWVLEEIKSNTKEAPIKILDIGTGSGCIAISLAKNLPNAEVYALDVSKEALKIAQENATLNSVKVHFMNKDILSTTDLPDSYDIIVSNPPYVRELEKQEIKNNVLNNEPHLALFVEDNNPLLFYDKIAELAKSNLTKTGVLFFEINQYLGKETVELVKNKGFQNIELKKDIFENDRMIKSDLKSK